jgi:hypothetical protein
MTESTIDVLTHRVKTIQGRRATLKSLGASTLIATAILPLTAGAGKKGKAGKKAKKKCKKQVGQCRTVITAACQGESDPEQCLAVTLPCCESLRGCNAGASLDCFFFSPETE